MPATSRRRRSARQASGTCGTTRSSTRPARAVSRRGPASQSRARATTKPARHALDIHSLTPVAAAVLRADVLCLDKPAAKAHAEQCSRRRNQPLARSRPGRGCHIRTPYIPLTGHPRASLASATGTLIWLTAGSIDTGTAGRRLDRCIRRPSSPVGIAAQVFRQVEEAVYVANLAVRAEGQHGDGLVFGFTG